MIARLPYGATIRSSVAPYGWQPVSASAHLDLIPETVRGN